MLIESAAGLTIEFLVDMFKCKNLKTQIIVCISKSHFNDIKKVGKTQGLIEFKIVFIMQIHLLFANHWKTITFPFPIVLANSDALFRC